MYKLFALLAKCITALSIEEYKTIVLLEFDCIRISTLEIFSISILILVQLIIISRK